MTRRARIYVCGQRYLYFIATLGNVSEAIRKLCNKPASHETPEDYTREEAREDTTR